MEKKMVDNSELAPSKKNIVWNSTIGGVIKSSSFRNPAKVKVLLYIPRVEVISVLHMEEEMTSIDKRTRQRISDMWIRDKGYLDAAQRQSKLPILVQGQRLQT